MQSNVVKKDDFNHVDFSANELIEKLSKLVLERQAYEQDKSKLGSPNVGSISYHSNDNVSHNNGDNDNDNEKKMSDEFDPMPYQRMFDKAIAEIESLRNDVDNEIKSNVVVAKTMEAQYKSQLNGFMHDLSNIMSEFRTLDSRISRVSQTAIRIGDRLETVEDQRKQILETNKLIDHFITFNQGMTHRIDPIFKVSHGRDLFDAAKLIIKLTKISNDMASPDTEKAKKLIYEISNRIQSDLRNEFLIAAKTHNFDTKSKTIHDNNDDINVSNDIKNDLNNNNDSKQDSDMATAMDGNKDDSNKDDIINNSSNMNSSNNNNNSGSNSINIGGINDPTLTRSEIMKECATLLWNFNDKEALNRFFKEYYLQGIDFNSPKYDLNAGLDGIEKYCKEFVASIKLSFQRYLEEIVNTFPDARAVIQIMIDKIFKEQLQGFLTNATHTIFIGYLLNSTGAGVIQRSSAMSGTNTATTTSREHSEQEDSLSDGKHQFDGNDSGRGNNENDIVLALNRQDRLEYISILNIMYTEVRILLTDLDETIDDLTSRYEDARSFHMLINKDELLEHVFGEHAKHYIELEVRHLEGSMRKLIRKHIICPLNLETYYDSEEENDEFGNGDSGDNFPYTPTSGLDDAIDALGGLGGSSLKSPSHSNSVSTTTTSTKKGGNSMDKMRKLTGMKFMSPPNAMGRKLTKQMNKMQAQSILSAKKSMKRIKAVKSKINIMKSAEEREKQLLKLKSLIESDVGQCVLLMIKESKSSIHRCKNITISDSKVTGQLSTNIAKLFNVFLNAMDNLLCIQLIPSCRSCLPDIKPKEFKLDSKDYIYLEAVQTINANIQLIEHHFNDDVAINMQDTYNFELTTVINTKNQKYVKFENIILAHVRQFLNSALNYIVRLLKNFQDKKDFSPKIEELSIEETQACLKVCGFINDFRSSVVKCLAGRNLDRFLLTFGTRLYFVIMEHLKRYQVSMEGAMILVRDMKLYQTTVGQFHIERVDEYFLKLVEFTTLLGVPAQSLNDLIVHDPKFLREKQEVNEWLKLRTDYKKEKIDGIVESIHG